MSINEINIMELHDSYHSLSSWPHGYDETSNTDINSLIINNHLYNSLLWEEEDLARRRYAKDSDIATNKRNIDKYNQKRNDYIEKIDESLLGNISMTNKCSLNSETAGSIIDRLSILSLKIYNMGIQTRRAGVSNEHINECSTKLNVLTTQRNDLVRCLDDLLTDLTKGLRYFKIYRQYKMYNDPNLNPEIYNEQK